MTTTGTQASGSDFFGLNEAMKAIFEDPISQNLVSESELLDLFEEDPTIQVKETYGGRYIELAHYIADGGGAGARAEGSYLPTPTPPTIKNSRIDLKKNLMVVEMSGQAYRRVKAGEAAFLDWAAASLPNAVRRLQHHLDRQAFGTGLGVMAKVTSVPGAGVINLQDAYGNTGSTDAALLFQRNDYIRLATGSDGSGLRANAAKVLSVDPVAGSITVDAYPTAAAAGDFIFLGDANGNNSRNPDGTGAGTVDTEMMGLLGMVDDGTLVATFQNLARAGLPEWQAVIQDSTASGFAATLSEDLLTYVDDQVFVLGGGKPDFLVTSRSGLRSYWKSLKGDRMFVDPRAYVGGKQNDGMKIMLGDRELGVKVTRKCPKDLAMLIEKASMKRWQVKGFQWDDTTGSIWKQVTDGTGRKDSFYAWGVYEAQLGCVVPRHNAKITSLAAA